MFLAISASPMVGRFCGGMKKKSAMSLVAGKAAGFAGWPSGW
jgi:uncharacterized membrane protein (UPF0136 family)